MRVLVAYASKRGSTREVAEAVAGPLAEDGLDVETRAADEVDDLTPYAGVVLGGGLYMGRWHKDARRFIAQYRKALRDMPVAVFAMGPDKMDAEKVAGSRAQLDRALAKVPEIETISVAIFGGVVDPSMFPFPLNRIPASDARDWDAIRTWADEVGAVLAGGDRAPRTTGAPSV